MTRLLAFFLAFIAFSASAQDKLAIGIITSLSGPMAAPGKFQMNGFRLAEEEINSGGGIAIGGRKYAIELKVYDTRANPAEGASAMQRLATVDRVPVVLGELRRLISRPCRPRAA